MSVTSTRVESADRPGERALTWACGIGLLGAGFAMTGLGLVAAIVLLAMVVVTRRIDARKHWDASERRHRELMDALARLEGR